MDSHEYFCVAGLGNPGKRYELTRHNVGFLFLSYLSRFYEAQEKVYATHWMGRFAVENIPILLLKPTQYMNLSGQAFREVLHYYKIPVERSIVCYDDISFPFGEFRLKPQGGAGGHKGLSSILDHMHTQKIPRLRFGVASKDIPMKENLSDFVLSPFHKQEQSFFEELFSSAREILEIFWREGIDQAMNKANRR